MGVVGLLVARVVVHWWRIDQWLVVASWSSVDIHAAAVTCSADCAKGSAPRFHSKWSLSPLTAPDTASTPEPAVASSYRAPSVAERVKASRGVRRLS